MRTSRTLTAASLVATFLLAAATGADARAEVLSNEKTLSRWAHPNDRAPVRRAPDASSRMITRLRYLTEDRQPEIYLALRRTWDESGQEWVKIRLPRRPNGSTGWVRRESFGPWHHVRTRLVINRRTLRARLYKRGRVVWQARVGVGAPRTPTPRGRFYIREKLIALEGGTIYGPLAFGTSAYSTLSDWPRGGVVGIHGTNQPHLIPGRPSHGCVRVRNRNIRQLARRMPLGTPLRIY
jgi:L,D-transpeptidase-like protein